MSRVARFETHASKPVLRLHRTGIEWILDIIALGGTLLCVLIVPMTWSTLPERIPIHFNLSGQPDGWGSRGTLILLPALLVVINVGLTLLARIPHRFNYLWPVTPDNAEQQYRIARSLLAMVKIEISGLFGYLTWMTVRTARGDSAGLTGMLLPTVLFVVFLTVFVHLLAAKRAA